MAATTFPSIPAQRPNTDKKRSRHSGPKSRSSWRPSSPRPSLSDSRWRLTGDTFSTRARDIIRAPCFDGAYKEVPNQMAVLGYIQQHTIIPVPTVFQFDPTPDKILGSVSAVQSWVDGRSLYDVMMETDFDDSMGIAKAIMELMSKMYATNLSRPLVSSVPKTQLHNPSASEFPTLPAQASNIPTLPLPDLLIYSMPRTTSGRSGLTQGAPPFAWSASRVPSPPYTPNGLSQIASASRTQISSLVISS